MAFSGPGTLSPIGVDRNHPYSLQTPPVDGKQTVFVRIRAKTINKCNRILLVMEEESDCGLVEVEL